MTDQQLQKLAQGILQGQRRDLAQAITAVETDESAADTLLSILPTVAGGFPKGARQCLVAAEASSCCSTR